MNDNRRHFLLSAGVLSLGIVPLMKKIMNNSGSANGKGDWECVVELDDKRNLVSGSMETLAAAIRHGADLRFKSAFHHNEHIDPKSTNPELIEEVMDWRVTYLLDNRWVAACCPLRQPVILLGNGFGPDPSLSLFMYNQDGRQAVARLFLKAEIALGEIGPSPLDVNDHSGGPKSHQFDSWDKNTNAPSNNFVWDFDSFRWYVRDDWKEVYAHAADGTPTAGSIDSLAEEFRRGREVKVGITGLCADLAGDDNATVPHEVFVHCGACYYYTVQKIFSAGSQPVVRVKPQIPLRYQSRGWDYGWLYMRTDGLVTRRIVNPYTLRFNDAVGQYAIRWFVR